MIDFLLYLYNDNFFTNCKQKSLQEKIADFGILFYRVNKSTEITPYLACLQIDRFLADCNLLLAFFCLCQLPIDFPFYHSQQLFSLLLVCEAIGDSKTSVVVG